MFTVLAALFLSAPEPKANTQELKWKFTKGDTVYVTVSMESTSNVTAGGGGGGALALQTNVTAIEYWYKLTATAADEKGAALDLTFISAQEGHGAGGAAPKLADIQGVAGNVVTCTLDKDQKITKVAGADAAAKGGNQLLQEDYLRYYVEDLLRAVPGKALGKGEEKHALSDGVVAKRSERGRVAGTEEGLMKLEVETDNAMVTEGKGRPFTFDLKGNRVSGRCCSTRRPGGCGN